MSNQEKRPMCITERVTLAMIITIFFAVMFFIKDGAVFADETNQTTDPEEKETLVIDGKTYILANDFVMPAGIDLDAPVRIIYSDESHEVKSIERLMDDTSNNDFFEYVFGTVDALSEADANMDYRVYVNGIGYLSTLNSRLDESIAFLEKGASVALVTYQGKIAICKVLASNQAVDSDDIFIGEIQHTKNSEDGSAESVTVNEREYKFGENTDLIGNVTEPGQWVFGYVIAGEISYISAIDENYPTLSSLALFSGFVSLVGEQQANGTYYLAIGSEALEITSDTAIVGTIQAGDYVVGARLDNRAIVVSEIKIPFSKENYSILNQAIDDAIYTTSPEYPFEKTMISVSVNGQMNNLDESSTIIGDLSIDTPVIGIATDGAIRIISSVAETDASLLQVAGVISSIRNNESGYEISLGDKTYQTDGRTHSIPNSKLQIGQILIGLADRNGSLLIMDCFDNSLPEASSYIQAGTIQSVSERDLVLQGSEYPITGETVVSGIPGAEKDTVVLAEDGFTRAVYILPTEPSDYVYKTISGALSGIQPQNSNGNQNVRIADTVFTITPDTTISNTLEYDEIAVALYKGNNEISILNIQTKPDDNMNEFTGTIEAEALVNGESILFSINGEQFSVSPVSAIVGFTNFSRLRVGAKVSGIAFGQDVLAIRLDRGAGLFGILDPPWLEFVLTGTVVLLLLLTVMHVIKRNRKQTITGVVDIGARENILITTPEGDIYNLPIKKELYEAITKFKGETVTVLTVGGKIVSME